MKAPFLDVLKKVLEVIREEEGSTEELFKSGNMSEFGEQTKEKITFVLNETGWKFEDFYKELEVQMSPNGSLNKLVRQGKIRIL